MESEGAEWAGLPHTRARVYNDSDLPQVSFMKNESCLGMGGQVLQTSRFDHFRNCLVSNWKTQRAIGPGHQRM